MDAESEDSPNNQNGKFNKQQTQEVLKGLNAIFNKIADAITNASDYTTDAAKETKNIEPKKDNTVASINIDLCENAIQEFCTKISNIGARFVAKGATPQTSINHGVHGTSGSQCGTVSEIPAAHAGSSRGHTGREMFGTRLSNTEIPADKTLESRAIRAGSGILIGHNRTAGSETRKIDKERAMPETSRAGVTVSQLLTVPTGTEVSGISKGHQNGEKVLGRVGNTEIPLTRSLGSKRVSSGITTGLTESAVVPGSSSKHKETTLCGVLTNASPAEQVLPDSSERPTEAKVTRDSRNNAGTLMSGNSSHSETVLSGILEKRTGTPTYAAKPRNAEAKVPGRSTETVLSRSITETPKTNAKTIKPENTINPTCTTVPVKIINTVTPRRSNHTNSPGTSVDKRHAVISNSAKCDTLEQKISGTSQGTMKTPNTSTGHREAMIPGASKRDRQTEISESDPDLKKRKYNESDTPENNLSGKSITNKHKRKKHNKTSAKKTKSRHKCTFCGKLTRDVARHCRKKHNKEDYKHKMELNKKLKKSDSIINKVNDEIELSRKVLPDARKEIKIDTALEIYMKETNPNFIDIKTLYSPTYSNKNGPIKTGDDCTIDLTNDESEPTNISATVKPPRQENVPVRPDRFEDKDKIANISSRDFVINTNINRFQNNLIKDIEAICAENLLVAKVKKENSTNNQEYNNNTVCSVFFPESSNKKKIYEKKVDIRKEKTVSFNYEKSRNDEVTTISKSHFNKHKSQENKVNMNSPSFVPVSISGTSVTPIHQKLKDYSNSGEGQKRYSNSTKKHQSGITVTLAPTQRDINISNFGSIQYVSQTMSANSSSSTNLNSSTTRSSPNRESLSRTANLPITPENSLKRLKTSSCSAARPDVITKPKEKKPIKTPISSEPALSITVVPKPDTPSNPKSFTRRSSVPGVNTHSRSQLTISSNPVALEVIASSSTESRPSKYTPTTSQMTLIQPRRSSLYSSPKNSAKSSTSPNTPVLKLRLPTTESRQSNTVPTATYSNHSPQKDITPRFLEPSPREASTKPNRKNPQTYSWFTPVPIDFSTGSTSRNSSRPPIALIPDVNISPLASARLLPPSARLIPKEPITSMANQKTSTSSVYSWHIPQGSPGIKTPDPTPNSVHHFDDPIRRLNY